MCSNLRIACWMSEKKLHKFNWPEFQKICKDNGYEAFKLDLEKDLESQGPFDFLLHKFTEIITLASQDDQNCARLVHDIELYISRNPSVVVIDPLPNIRQLLDRYKCYSVIDKINPHSLEVFTPNFCEIVSNDPNKIKQELQRANVHYPFICKPIVGHGSKAHQMCIIFNERSLQDCKPPCVAQSFLNHNAILYKIFIVGDRIHVCERPSLKNFLPGEQSTIFFNSTSISKAGSQNKLSTLDPEDRKSDVIKPDLNMLETIAACLRKAFGLDLFGIDVIIENSTGRYAVIDVNSFPGYDGFPNFFVGLMECIKSKLKNRSPNITTKPLSASSAAKIIT